MLAKAISWPRNLRYTEPRGLLVGRDFQWDSYEKSTSQHTITFCIVCERPCVYLVAYSLDDTPHLGDSVSILDIRVLHKSLQESLSPHSNLRSR